jgi:hypothetical protein
MAIDAVSDPAFLPYWGSYEAANGIVKGGCSIGTLSCGAAHVLALPFVPAEGLGLGVDAGGDWLKSRFLPGYAGVGDEGKTNSDPWLLGSQAGPWCEKLFGTNWHVKSFPGIDKKGHIDFQW